MARMIPRDLRFENSDAEREVFAALRDALSDDYTVLHHVAWVQRRGRNRGAIHGETDFVIVHPERGVLVVEVKGGGIRFEASTGRWYTRNRYGESNELRRPPMEQAKDAHFALRAWLGHLPGWNSEWGNAFGHAVCFPDVVFDAEPLPDLKPGLVFDEATVRVPGQLKEAVDAALGLWADARRPLGDAGAELVINALAHDVVLRQPLGLFVRDAERDLLELSERQYDILYTLSKLPRVAVSGPAGSGKTLIAAEKATRMARDEGASTLLVCYNRPLADYLRSSLAQVRGLEVWGFHQLCAQIGHRARIPTPPGGWASRNSWPDLPRVLEEGAARLGPQYDAIVVDEGQDFDASWWPGLESLLHDPQEGTLYVFFDDNQTIYARPRGLPAGMAKVPLTENFRNAKPVFRTVMTFYSGEQVVCRGPDGPEVETRAIPAANLRHEVGQTLQLLIAEEQVGTSDIVVLTPRRVEVSGLLGRAGGFNLTPEPTEPDDIQLSTIHRFKGLDAPAVVLCEIDRASGKEYDELLYVGCSRARVLLKILLTE